MEYRFMTLAHDPGVIHHVLSAHTTAAGIPWATIASSVGGMATAGALLVSLAVLWQNNRTQQQAQQDRHREHASQVSFWLTLSSVVPTSYAAQAQGIEMTVHVVNTSTRPAMAVLALVGVRSDVWRDAGTTDGLATEERGVQWRAVAVGPGERHDVVLHLEAPAAVVKIVADYGNDALIGELLFTDAAGVSWVRTHDGHLIERRSDEWAENMHMSLGQRHEQRRNKPR
jgi:hypothetical protein